MRTNVKPVGQRVCFNEDGLRWATNHRGTPARGERVEWRGRVDVVAKMSRDRTQARGRLEWLQDSQRLFADEVSEVGLALRLELGQFLDHLERWSRVPELLTQPRLAVNAPAGKGCRISIERHRASSDPPHSRLGIHPDCPDLVMIMGVVWRERKSEACFRFIRCERSLQRNDMPRRHSSTDGRRHKPLTTARRKSQRIDFAALHKHVTRSPKRETLMQRSGSNDASRYATRISVKQMRHRQADSFAP